MTTCFTPLVALTLLGWAAAASGAQLGRLDIAAPGAMISTCGGVTNGGGAPGDKNSWIASQFNCNAAQAAVPNASVAQSVNYFVNGASYIDALAHGQTVMGQTKLYAHSRATANVGEGFGGFAAAVASGGWVDMLTLNPRNAADIGKTASFTFALNVEGLLAGQGAVHSFNSLARFGVKPYINDASLPPGPASEFALQGQGQIGFPYNAAVNQLTLFTGNITLGTPFELGVFARAWAGNASSGPLFVFSEATADFSSAITWAGISSLTLGGAPVAYTLSSASGIDWIQPFASTVPEPATWALWTGGLLGMGALRRRRRAASCQPAQP